METLSDRRSWYKNISPFGLWYITGKEGCSQEENRMQAEERLQAWMDWKT